MAMVIDSEEAALLLERVLDRVSLDGENVMIERPQGQPVVLVPLDEYVVMTAALLAAARTGETEEDAEVFSLDARRRCRDARAAPPAGTAPCTAP